MRPADPCEIPGLTDSNGKNEASLFGDTAQIIVDALNAPASVGSTSATAEHALRALEQESSEINTGWAPENRLHAQVMDLPPALVVKVSFRTYERFFAFGKISTGSAPPVWQLVGEDDVFLEHLASRSWVKLYPLQRGPSGRARFLADFTYTGCAGSLGTVSSVYQWNPSDGAVGFEQLIHQEGALGLGQGPADGPGRAEDAFPTIGNLETRGRILSLPYCWFSAIDTWDNPSLCAVDRYDLSGDDPAFLSRAYNRPDLLPIAKVIEFAKNHDYPAVRAYCNSDELAHRLVRHSPGGAEDLGVRRISANREIVELTTGRFVVERRSRRWLVVSYQPE